MQLHQVYIFLAIEKKKKDFMKILNHYDVIYTLWKSKKVFQKLFYIYKKKNLF